MPAGRIQIVLFTMLLLFCNTLPAQRSARGIEFDRNLKQGFELWDKEKYSAAMEYFEKVIDGTFDREDEKRIQAEYFSALCSMKLFHRDTEVKLLSFVEQHPESPWVKSVYFQLGNFSYRKRKFITAVAWYQKVNLKDLNEDETREYHFKKGYSHFREDEYSYAKVEFAELINEPNIYYAPSNYYNGHIAYTNGNYEQALQSFDRIKEDENFYSLVPYYIAQLYYLKKDYKTLIEYVSSIPNPEDVKRFPEIAKLAGDSYYREMRYTEAIPYLEKYIQGGGQLNRADYYQYGFAQYRSDNYPVAIEYLAKVATIEDSLTQLATYQMGDCYLKNDEKTYARNAFKTASDLDFDREIKEDALFNYAKIAYELSVNPFHEAIRAFQKYLEMYPNSPRRDEAYEFLLNVYMTSKNYKEAFEALEKIQNKDNKVKSAYQVVVFNRAVELLNDRKFDQSATYFKKVNTYSENQKLTAEAIYWLAEIDYKKKNYTQAIAKYKAFLVEPGAYESKYFQEAYYGSGYSNFLLNDYINSASDFKTYTSNYKKDDERKLNDAYLRLGDCYYVQKAYDQALSGYGKAKELNLGDADYALYQSAKCYGYKEDFQKKITTLQLIENNYPKSPYLAASLFEIGDTYFKRDKIAEARPYFERILSDFGNTSYTKKSLKTMGLIHYRNRDFDKAILTFKSVVENYPNNEDSREALNRIQDIYAETGNIDEYNSWVGSLENIDVSQAAQDSVNYRSAENKYSSSDCTAAIEAFEKYLQKFQPAIFALNANFYKAECEYKAENYSEALIGYNFVISQPTNQFTESALLAAATITYFQNDFDQALNHYIELEKIATFSDNILEAQIGQMRCYFQKQQFEPALQNAQSVLANNKSPERIVKEAHLISGKIYEAQGKDQDALLSYDKVVKLSSGIMGAEAKYLKSMIYYRQKDYLTSEKEIFELIKNYPSYEKWKIDGFLLLSDVYVGLEDYFQAKATLQSILDNVDDEAVQKITLEKYQAILELEKKSQAVQGSNDVEINIEKGDDFEELFEDDPKNE